MQNLFLSAEFFTKEKIDTDDENSVYYTSKNSENEFNWADIPSLNNNKNAVKNLVVSLREQLYRLNMIGLIL